MWYYNGQPINGQVIIGDVQYPSGFNFTGMNGFTLVEPEPLPDPPPCQAQQITMRQCRLILHQYGLLLAVQQVVSTLGTEAQIEWEYASTVERSNPLVSAVAIAAGMSEDQINVMFTEASLL